MQASVVDCERRMLRTVEGATFYLGFMQPAAARATPDSAHSSGGRHPPTDNASAKLVAHVLSKEESAALGLSEEALAV